MGSLRGSAWVSIAIGSFFGMACKVKSGAYGVAAGSSYLGYMGISIDKRVF
jgi:hypothetical protein